MVLDQTLVKNSLVILSNIQIERFGWCSVVKQRVSSFATWSEVGKYHIAITVKYMRIFLSMQIFSFKISNLIQTEPPFHKIFVLINEWRENHYATYYYDPSCYRKKQSLHMTEL